MLRRALLAEHPHDGVGDVALAAAVGPDDRRATPGSKTSSVCRENDLKPLMRSERRYTRLHPAVARRTLAAGGFVADAAPRRRRRRRRGALAGRRAGRGSSPAARRRPAVASRGPAGRAAAGGRAGARGARLGLSALLQLAQRLGGGLLLGALLAGPERRDPSGSPSTTASITNSRVVRRPARLDQPVGDRAARLGELLLQLGLEVDVAALGVRDVLGEGLDHGRAARRRSRR